ncbi:hypothetical protein AMATHDRAFT_2796 [Amanita thiersii Skay4041]|uniref:Uncharacterized protein n=1 Tax=Amanita thiersii Skay4041 TaxID=703135 RepID=A0A2A9NTR2_9AGAR|nr:hypothetical protein AMATHDRAFT_2796 [Amanita thiersii Skay4041]
MTSRAPFPSFTTVILSTQNSYCPNYDRHTPNEDYGPAHRVRQKDKVDFMKTIDLRENFNYSSSFLLPDYYPRLDESSTVADDDKFFCDKKNEHLRADHHLSHLKWISRIFSCLRKFRGQELQAVKNVAKQLKFDLNN